MKSAFFLALALSIPSTAALATSVAEKANSKLTEPTARKAGCTRCSCCDFIVLGGLKIPVGFPVAGASPRPE